MVCPVCNQSANLVDMISTSYWYCSKCKEDVEFLKKTQPRLEGVETPPYFSDSCLCFFYRSSKLTCSVCALSELKAEGLIK